MAKETILVVEDEEDVLELVRYNISKNGYNIETAITGEDGITKTRKIMPDLVILDLMLPSVDGLEVCKILKNDQKTEHIPIVMLTAKGEEADIVTGLELGADDYITKPFSPRVLIARIKAVLRRKLQKTAEDTNVIKIHNLEVKPKRHEVLVDGKSVTLTFTEFSLLHFLIKQPGWVFTRYQIVDAIHGHDYPVTDRSIDVQIVGLRKKLGSAGKYIQTVRGVGYKFKE